MKFALMRIHIVLSSKPHFLYGHMGVAYSAKLRKTQWIQLYKLVDMKMNKLINCVRKQKPGT
jgi:hypothetical protein